MLIKNNLITVKSIKKRVALVAYRAQYNLILKKISRKINKIQQILKMKLYLFLNQLKLVITQKYKIVKIII